MIMVDIVVFKIFCNGFSLHLPITKLVLGLEHEYVELLQLVSFQSE